MSTERAVRARGFGVFLGIAAAGAYAQSCSDNASEPSVRDAEPERVTHDAAASPPDALADAAADVVSDAGTDAASDGTVTDAASDGAVTDAAGTCVGNPLTADGGTPEGGAIITSGISQIDDEKLERPGLTTWYADGLQFIDFDGGGPPGALVFSSFDRA